MEDTHVGLSAEFGASIWDICNSADYVVLAARVTQLQIDEHDANSRARNALFSCLSMSEFDRVSHLPTAREIWATLMRFHEGTTQVKSRLYESHKREYENFRHMPGESIESLFARFQVIVNRMRANKELLPFDDHERALKLLHTLDRSVWDSKVQAIIESSNYETLTCDELFSKLKSSEIDAMSRA
ncbi:hypothetical protein, partial [Haemophilus sp. SZY H53]